MDVFLRNITTDEDVEVSLPMDSGKLKELTGKDEWIIADSPVGEELTGILTLNKLVERFGEENLIVLAEAFLLSEIEEEQKILWQIHLTEKSQKKSEPHRRTLKQISVNTVKKRLVTAVLLTA